MLEFDRGSKCGIWAENSSIAGQKAAYGLRNILFIMWKLCVYKYIYISRILVGVLEFELECLKYKLAILNDYRAGVRRHGTVHFKLSRPQRLVPKSHNITTSAKTFCPVFETKKYGYLGSLNVQKTGRNSRSAECVNFLFLFYGPIFVISITLLLLDKLLLIYMQFVKTYPKILNIQTLIMILK